MNDQIQKLVQDSLKYQFIKGVNNHPYSAHEFSHWRKKPWLIIVYTPNEEYRCQIKGNEYCSSNGELILIPTQVPHKSTFANSGRLSVIHIQYTILGGIDLLSFYNLPIHVKKEYALKISKGMTALSNSYQSVESFSITKMVERYECAFRLLLLILDGCELNPEKVKLLNKIHRLESALNFIEQNYDRGISRDQIAEVACLSPARFNTIFTDTIGIPPMKYVKNMRMQQAMSLLKNDNISIEEISRKLGFCDSFHFSKQFRSSIGFSPSKYRKNLNATLDELIS